jgi:Xaa-Pro dipeptidase
VESHISGPPIKELSARVEKLQQEMLIKEVGGIIVVQKTDLYYFAGTSQQGWLYIPAEGKPLLMIFKEFGRAVIESSLEKIISLVSPKKIPQALIDQGYMIPQILGLELDVLPANFYFQYRSIFSDSKIVDFSTPIRLIRAVKSAYEIDLMREAARLSDKVAARVPELLEVGKTEVALAGELEAYARSLGHQGIVRMRLFGSELFYGHLISGPAAAVPSYLASPTGGVGVSGIIGQGAGYKKIARHEIVLVDYVFALNGYISDHARIFVMGELTDDLYMAHEAMLDIQEKTKKAALPGVSTGEIYDMMVSMAEEKGYGDHFMGVGERKIRFTGHGVGLELDEFPFIAKGQTLELAEGMVLALEPKVILPGQGVVGIENTHLVTAAGLEPLTVFEDAICKLP